MCVRLGAVGVNFLTHWRKLVKLFGEKQDIGTCFSILYQNEFLMDLDFQFNSTNTYCRPIRMPGDSDKATQNMIPALTELTVW